MTDEQIADSANKREREFHYIGQVDYAGENDVETCGRFRFAAAHNCNAA